MSQHKALLLSSPKGPLVIGTNTVPNPGPGELLIKVYSASLNPVDWGIKEYDVYVKEYPVVLGMDMAGTVVELGEGVSTFKKGDRVYISGALILQCKQIPDFMSFDDAAAVPLCLATAAMGLFNKVHGIGLFPPWENGGRGLYHGKPLVVVGGSSTVGQFVIQLAKLSGFSPIIATASKHNTEYLIRLGATHVIDRDMTSDMICIEIANITSEPIEVSYDAAGDPKAADLAYDLLSPGGCAVLHFRDEKKNRPDRRAAYVLGNAHRTANRNMGISLFSKLPALLEEGAIRPNRVEVLPNGLEGVVFGLERLKRGISSLKLIAHPQETA
ncbi:uncharacterized protein FIBRA_00623 [Fibroporia radiculosa]|uniref:Enoyl reductase (ER) domain-containing protein n=1 Tax=Fibroporia radiculosa TaxID=599839 RepID=J4I815_9APHY|nr:uncharacterized protein FIBRA_00623 [Fibroporia radiculosa]CCL98621.1 predicted protein [Fibroporia radiculosa]